MSKGIFKFYTVDKTDSKYNPIVTYHLNGWITIAVFLLALIAVSMAGCPAYNVWQQEMRGKAELKRAEQNRQIKIRW